MNDLTYLIIFTIIFIIISSSSRIYWRALLLIASFYLMDFISLPFILFT